MSEVEKRLPRRGSILGWERRKSVEKSRKGDRDRGGAGKNDRKDRKGEITGKRGEKQEKSEGPAAKE